MLSPQANVGTKIILVFESISVSKEILSGLSPLVNPAETDKYHSIQPDLIQVNPIGCGNAPGYINTFIHLCKEEGPHPFSAQTRLSWSREGQAIPKWSFGSK